MVLNKKIEKISSIELLKSFRTIRQDWRTKTPYQKWCFLYNIGRATLKLLAYPLYENDQTLKPLSHLTLALTVLVECFGIYTLYFCVIHGEFAKFLPSTCFISGPILAVSYKNITLYLLIYD